MKKRIKTLLFLTVAMVAGIALTACSGNKTMQPKKQTPKKAILIAAFGTSTPAVSTYDKIDKLVVSKYPNHEVIWGWSADFIVNKVRKLGKDSFGSRNIKVRSLTEAYQYLKDQGTVEVSTLALLIAPGGEYNQLLKTETFGMDVTVTEALMEGDEWREDISSALEDHMVEEGAINVVVAHGNDHHPEYNKELIALDAYLRDNYENTMLITVEGQPGFEKGVAEAKESPIQKINFIPGMYVAGDHVINDVMGEEEDSYKSQIGKEATLKPSLGEQDKILAMYMKKLEKIIK